MLYFYLMKTAVKVCLWILAFIPLIVDTNVFFPYTSGKNLLIESGLLLAGVLLLINFFYSRDFRAEITGKIIKYLKQPVVLSILAFFSIFIISTIFAVDKFSAFWGNVERAEGLVGLTFFLAFFVFSLLVFEKKDWLWFFKLSLFVSLILLIRQFIEFFHDGIVRPGSYTGNPTFLAGYLLFSISAALIILGLSKDLIPRFWKILAIFAIILSTIGIFMAQTRGTIFGLILGIVAVLVYCAFKGKDISYKKLNLRAVAISFLCLGLIFSGVFTLTRKNEIWQKVPGLARVAVIGSGEAEDLSTPVRTFLFKSSLEAVNPLQNGWKKFLFGWGPDNFVLAESKHYNIGLYNIEPDWHDRAHNKILDVLVMNGLFGLLVYILLWLFFFRLILKGKDFSLVRIGLLFFSISFLIHLLFVFDEISTSIPFFLLLAFAVYFNTNNIPEKSKITIITKEMTDRREIITGTFLVILTLFLGYIFFVNTLSGYTQMRDYFSLVSNSDSSVIGGQIDSVFVPFTTAQMNIRGSLLKVAADNYNKNKAEISLKLLTEATSKSIEYVDKRPLDVRFAATLAGSLNSEGYVFNNKDYLKKGEELFRKILTLAPNRPDMMRGLALNLYYQERYAESFSLFEKAFNLDPDYFNTDKAAVEGAYTRFIQYFYTIKDKENFTKTADRLKVNNYDNSALLDKILDYLDKNNVWPVVNFQ